ncbi:MAG: LysR family transcriptional regulator [Clostridium sp.]
MDKHNKINLEYYKVFSSVCRMGSITMAADELCISQPAVSQVIKQLETSLECKLFFRTSKGVKPTKEGDVLYSYVKKGIEALYDGEDMIRRIKNLDTGEIRIGASDMTLQFYLLPYLERFHEEYPKVKVTVSNGPTPETIGFLYEGKIDFGIVSTPFDAKSEICSLPVKQINNIFIAGDKFKNELQGRKLKYTELLKYPCIFLEKNTSTRRFMDQYLEKQAIRLEPEFELATSDMIVQFVKRNLGIGCLMSEFAKEALDADEVFSLEFEEEMPERQFSLITTVKDSMSPAAVKLLAELVENSNTRAAT